VSAIKVLHVCPLPPLRSGIVDYGAVFRQALNGSGLGLELTPLRLPAGCGAPNSLHDLGGIRHQFNHLLAAAAQSDLLHFELGYHNAREFHLLLRLSLSRASLPVVVTLHDPPRWLVYPFSVLGLEGHGELLRKAGRALDISLGPILERVARRGVDRLLVLSREGAELMSSKLPPGKVAYIPHLLYRGERPEPKSSGGRIRMLSLGFLGAGKDVEVLLRAAGFLVQREWGARFELLIGGQPPRLPGAQDPMEGYQRLVESLGLQGAVQFLGYVPDEQMLALFESADVFVLPYPRQAAYSSSGVNIRAMETGAAVVASRGTVADGLLEPGRTGLTFEPNDAQDLAAQLQRLIEDDDLRVRLGRAAQDQVWQKHNWARVARIMATIYGQLLWGRSHE
jgi:glycosyltransferase involved in cell wall biosynthesis